MGNRIVIGFLVFLVIISGGIGYYAFTVSQQVGSLSEQLNRVQAEQAASIDLLGQELAEQEEDFRKEFIEVQSSLRQSLSAIKGLEDRADSALLQLESLEDGLSQTQDRTDELEEEIAANTELARSLAGATIDAAGAFERVGQATVRISNGERTIGSGFVYDDAAHIITAQHVTADLSRIYAVFPDGKISLAKITGADAFSDVTVLELVEDIAVAPPVIADSSNLEVGEPVVVTGSPFDLEDSLTSGIVSQVNRFAEIEDGSQSRWIANLIQFDAAVNFGNSGGPLANADGEIIGLVIARINPEEGDGVYYAVSANKFRRVAEAIIANGSFDYPWLGAAIQDLTPQAAQDLDLETINGVLVSGVASGGPSEAAGMEAEDIILTMDGIPMTGVAKLVSYLGEEKTPGDETTLSVLRNADQIELTLEVGSRPG